MSKPVQGLSSFHVIVAMVLSLPLNGGLRAAAAQPEVAPPAVRPLGEVTLRSGPRPCDDEDCHQLQVRCPEVAHPASVLLKVGRPTRTPVRGTILFMTGGGGARLWDDRPEARRVLSELRASGFQTVQLEWTRGWLVGAEGALEGQAARLPARHGCQVGLRQTALSGTRHGLLRHRQLRRRRPGQLHVVALRSGRHPRGRGADWRSSIRSVDLGCLRDDPASESLWYEREAAGLVDDGFGFLNPGSGPCSRGDDSFRRQFEQASIVSPEGQYVYPNTMVWFLSGDSDVTNAVPQGALYRDHLIGAGSPLVRADVIPDTWHGVPGSPEGAAMIRDVMLKECRPR